MVPFGLGIEHDALVGQGERAQQSRFDEEVQRVVDRGSRDVGKLGLNALPYEVSRGVLIGVQNVFGDGDTLGRRLDAMFAESVRGANHPLRLCLNRDLVNYWPMSNVFFSSGALSSDTSTLSIPMAFTRNFPPSTSPAFTTVACPSATNAASWPFSGPKRPM